MRNNEIARIRLKDIIKIRDCRFINVLESKTNNGIRIIPIHPFVHDKLVAYAKKRNLGDDDYLLSTKGRITSSWVFDKACITLCEKLRKKLNITNVKEYLAKENITFYSGRHFWKTLMSANGLGDVEEYFMGHKVSSDVSRRYNRKDKIGQSMLIKKAHEVFKILDKWVFKA
jgi:integrase